MRSHPLGVVILLGLCLSGCKGKDKDKAVPVAAPATPAQPNLADAQRASAVDPSKNSADAVPALVGAEYEDAAQLPYQTERRLEPSAAGNPTHATVRLLRKIGEGDWDLEPLLSQTRGLFIRLVVDEGVDYGGRYCGERLKAGKEQAMYFFEYVIERLEYKDVEITCANKPRPPRCFVGMAGHDHPRFEMRFADTERGLELVSILEFDWGQPEVAEKAEVAAVEAELARLTASPCP